MVSLPQACPARAACPRGLSGVTGLFRLVLQPQPAFLTTQLPAASPGCSGSPDSRAVWGLRRILPEPPLRGQVDGQQPFARRGCLSSGGLAGLGVPVECRGLLVFSLIIPLSLGVFPPHQHGTGSHLGPKQMAGGKPWPSHPLASSGPKATPPVPAPSEHPPGTDPAPLSPLYAAWRPSSGLDPSPSAGSSAASVS